MTYQHDPNSTRERMRSQIRRDDGSWGMVPILLVLVAILGLGYYAFNRMNEPGPNPRSTTTENTRPGATTPPAATPAQPTTPKQP
jgi:hypothetical protein